jgi:protein gp37
MSDLFHEAVPMSFIDAVFSTIFQCPQHVFQILTKRPDRMREYLKSRKFDDPKKANFWLGVSVEDQKTADARIPVLLETPAPLRFVSIEPMLGAIDLGRSVENCEQWSVELLWRVFRTGYEASMIDWVIVGGESGPEARPMHQKWVRSIRNQCAAARVPFFFKSWGEWCEATLEFSGNLNYPYQRMDGIPFVRVGKARTGRLLKGVTYSEYPDRWPVNTLRTCRVCGCTDDDCRQCIEKTGRPCHWVEYDLCSACQRRPGGGQS